jgi:phosphatidylglycerol lysyltransferase
VTGFERRRFVAALLAAITLCSGILNLISVVGGAPQPTMLVAVFPLEFSPLSRTLTILIGFGLIISSFNIYKRKKRALAIVLALSSLSTILHLTRELNYRETMLSSALFLLLLFTRNTFTVKSSRPDFRSGLLRLLVSAVVAVSYGITGFWLLDERQFGMNFRIEDAIAATLRCLSLSGDQRLLPHTQYGHWFLDSLFLITLTAGVYSGFALFRPMLYRFRIVPRERAIAREIVRRYARTPLDLFKLWPDKSYFFSPSQRCVIAYRVADNTAIALGDPVGPEAEIGATVREFLEMCRENGWAVAFYQILPDFLPMYRRLGMKTLKIGDDAIVDLPEFSLQGKSKRELRSKVRQLDAIGIHTCEFQPPVPDGIIAQLKAVSDQWLRIPGRRERSFTLGQFDPDYLRSKPVLVALDSSGTVLAFINLISVDGSEITGDLMRRRRDAPNGIMDYLFIKLFLYARERGYARVSLGMAPMTGFEEREGATTEERAIHGLFQKLDCFFSFRGLYHYKSKFATSWEPRYLVYRSILELPRTAFALRHLSEIRKEKNVPGANEDEPAYRSKYKIVTMPCSKLMAIGALILAFSATVCAENPKPGKNELTIRGQRETVYFYPAEGDGPRRKILFAPGDGRWRGFAITITEELAKAGYDVYCIDTRRYLESFTGPVVLSTAEISADFNQMARWIQQGGQERLLLIGWSEGAGLALAATANAANQTILDGLLAIGTPEYNILAWHWTDIGAEITKKLPHEPTFKSADFIASVSPLPLFVIASTSNEYVTPEATRALFSAAREPKRLFMIDARDHKYSGNTEGFFRALREGLNWIQQQHR